MRVSTSVVLLPGRPLGEIPTKNRRVRMLAVDDLTASVLRAQIQLVEERARVAGVELVADPYLFTGKNRRSHETTEARSQSGTPSWSSRNARLSAPQRTESGGSLMNRLGLAGDRTYVGLLASRRQASFRSLTKSGSLSEPSGLLRPVHSPELLAVQRARSPAEEPKCRERPDHRSQPGRPNARARQLCPLVNSSSWRPPSFQELRTSRHGMNDGLAVVIDDTPTSSGSPAREGPTNIVTDWSFVANAMRWCR